MKKIVDDITKNKINRMHVDVIKTCEFFGVALFKKTITKHCQDNIFHYQSDDIYLFGRFRIYSIIKGKWEKK